MQRSILSVASNPPPEIPSGRKLKPPAVVTAEDRAVQKMKIDRWRGQRSRSSKAQEDWIQSPRTEPVRKPPRAVGTFAAANAPVEPVPLSARQRNKARLEKVLAFASEDADHVDPLQHPVTRRSQFDELNDERPIDMHKISVSHLFTRSTALTRARWPEPSGDSDSDSSELSSLSDSASSRHSSRTEQKQSGLVPLLNLSTSRQQARQPTSTTPSQAQSSTHTSSDHNSCRRRGHPMMLQADTPQPGRLNSITSAADARETPLHTLASYELDTARTNTARSRQSNREEESGALRELRALKDSIAREEAALDEDLDRLVSRCRRMMTE